MARFFQVLVFVVYMLTRICAFNEYFEYNNRTFHVCVSQKSGSTSMSYQMYESMANTTAPWPESCRKQRINARQFSCGFEDIPTFKIIIHKNKLRHIDYALLQVRHPLHRIVSAWKSKIRPNKCTTSRDSRIDAMRDKLYKTWKTSFVSFSEFVNKFIHEKNNHWNPQFNQCGMPDAYDDVVHLKTINATSFINFSNALGVPFRMKRRHSSNPDLDSTLQVRKKRVLRPSTSTKRNRTFVNMLQDRHDVLKRTHILERIYTFYKDDYEHYGFPQNINDDMQFLIDEFSQYDKTCLFSSS